MNILNSSYRYLEDIFKENCGVKALITDAETLTTISLSMTRTELLSHDVIDTEELSEVCRRPVNPIVSALKCVCILRPSRENLDLLSSELSTAPHFSRYSLYFTNLVFEPQIRQLAKFDKYGLIDHVEEIYLDYYPLNFRLFSLNSPQISELRNNQSADLFLTRITDNIFASLCSLQLKPIVRFDGNSPLCKQLAKCVFERISGSNFNAPGEPSLLLILDRASDPLSPLLHPWFYSGAIHDLFGIKNNLVSIPLKNDPIVFDERHDSFIQEYGCRFLADVGPAVAQKMSAAKKLNESAKQQITSPDQIADVVSAASKFQEEFSVVGNHVSLVESINAQVNSSSLINIGELEQSMATSDDAQGHFQEILRLSQNATRDEVLRLLLIYALRYEGRANDQLSALKEKFPSCVGLMETIVRISGNDRRGPDDIFGSRRKLQQLFTDIRALCVEQSMILDQYKCLLSMIIDRVKKGSLSADMYPFVGPKKNESTFKPKRMIVFYVGGTTYYEMRAAYQAADIDVVVGGTTVHNAMSYIRNEIQPFA